MDADHYLQGAGPDRSRRSQSALHAVGELVNDGVSIEPLIDDIANCIVVEEYPDYHKGPCVLVLQFDEAGAPMHLVWGIPANATRPAVLVTAYRPDPQKWDETFTRRTST